MVKELSYDQEESEFDIQSYNLVHYRINSLSKRINSIIFPCYKVKDFHSSYSARIALA